jgi:hypothetical protein
VQFFGGSLKAGDKAIAKGQAFAEVRGISNSPTPP